MDGKQNITPEQFRFFAEMVKTTSGISLAPGKEYLLESRLSELSKVLGLRSLEELYRKAKFQLTSPLKEQIVEAMTTNETYFFRDQHPFDALRTQLVPELMSERKDCKSLRFWSAACSTGQEPYSVALLLNEHFPALATWQVDVLATDISMQAVQKGRDGRFTQVEVNRGLPITLLIKHFKQHGPFWMISDKLRSMVHFKQMNLLTPFTGLGNFDIIFCRYVLIYFEQDTKRQILEKMTRALAPGGYLFLGATETPVGLPSSMKRTALGRATCWQKVA